MSHESIEVLIQGLREGNSDRRRLTCAIKLMKVAQPEVTSAYIGALADPFDKVVQIACMKLGHRGGEAAISSLLRVLEQESWYSRLEACKALILLQAVDLQVISTLKGMIQESDAAKYDAMVEEIEATYDDPECPEELKGGWGKIGSIVEQAQLIAARRNEPLSESP